MEDLAAELNIKDGEIQEHWRIREAMQTTLQDLNAELQIKDKTIETLKQELSGNNIRHRGDLNLVDARESTSDILHEMQTRMQEQKACMKEQEACTEKQKAKIEDRVARMQEQKACMEKQKAKIEEQSALILWLQSMLQSQVQSQLQ